MRPPWTISRYIAREVVLYSLLGMAAVSIVFVGQNLLRYLDRFLMIGVQASDVLAILRCVTVIMLAYTLPIAFLFGVLVAVGRMAADVEITAMRACGVGLRDLVLPVVTLGFIVSCFTWYVALEVENRAKRELREALVAMTASGTIIEPGRFTRIGDRMFYVQSRDRENRLRGVMISDQSNPKRPLLIFAERGRLDWKPEQGVANFRLEEGSLHVEGDERSPDTYYRMSFSAFEYAFQVQRLLEVHENQIRPKDMKMEELREIVARGRAGGSLGHLLKKTVPHYEVEIHRRLALPVAPMLFALTAVPLSLRRSRGARSWGVLLCGTLVAVYYGILTFSQFLALQGRVPASLALWFPNAAFAATAAWLLFRARRFGD